MTNNTVEARWSTLDAMAPAAWSAVRGRVSVCLECLGPALLTNEELALFACAPQCRRCKAAGNGLATAS